MCPNCSTGRHAVGLGHCDEILKQFLHQFTARIVARLQNTDGARQGRVAERNRTDPFGNGAPDPPLWGYGHTKPVEDQRSEEHTSELQSLMRISYAVFCLKKKT